MKKVQHSLQVMTTEKVPLRREWSVLEEEDESFTLKVPVSADMVVPLRPRYDFDRVGNADELQHESADFAKALINITRGRSRLERYAARIRSEALRQVEKARSEGIDIRFEKVAFKPTLAHFLAHEDFRKGIEYVIAEIDISVLQVDFRRATITCLVEQVEDVAAKIAECAEQQEINQRYLDILYEADADLEVDEVDANILELCNLDVATVLSTVLRDGRFLQNLDDGTEVSATAPGGQVRLVVEGDAFSWKNAALATSSEVGGREIKVGETVASLVAHPAFANRPVCYVERSASGRPLFLYEGGKMKFDVETGTLLPFPARAA